MTQTDPNPPKQSPPGSTGTGVLASAPTEPTLMSPPPGVATGANSAPTLVEPHAVVTAGGVTAATWRSGQITGLWSIDEARNAWMLVDGLGWRKLYNGRDAAFQALTALASQARQTGRSINFREEADGMVYEIYLW